MLHSYIVTLLQELMQLLLSSGNTALFDTYALKILNSSLPDYGTTGGKKICLLILNRVCHANVTDYRNYSLIWHTCLGSPELTLTWLRNYGPKKNMFVDFEALRASIIWRLQKLQPKMKHSVWISWSCTDPTTELRAEKKNVCWFCTRSAIEMLLTSGSTTLFDTQSDSGTTSASPWEF